MHKLTFAKQNNNYITDLFVVYHILTDALKSLFF